MEVAELLVVAIQHLPKDLYFPENDSLIQSLYGQTGIPNTRDLILISREPEKIQKELFNIPTVSVCYRAIYSVFIANIFKQEDGDIFKEEVRSCSCSHVDRVLAAGCRRR